MEGENDAGDRVVVGRGGGSTDQARVEKRWLCGNRDCCKLVEKSVLCFVCRDGGHRQTVETRNEQTPPDHQAADYVFIVICSFKLMIPLRDAGEELPQAVFLLS
ncbi:hypothetical protein PGTUg99_036328 [Puccinia graminis f. sp. tritici]|uniref:Uncharacterized protein n=1 Tax=Puccinia graminis f. sp. tritici TaxID=56615 RepID=A0A5B0SGL8_PUCGR|nr:hypothetical protein PGTUg99_036328 [Puccinia graminis f. sp. tritici]